MSWKFLIWQLAWLCGYQGTLLRERGEMGQTQLQVWGRFSNVEIGGERLSQYPDRGLDGTCGWEICSQ